MFKFLRKKIKSRDVFGKEISLNIDGDESHKTWFGGFISILISIVMIGYIYLLFKKCITHGEDVMNYIYIDENPEELGQIAFKEINEVIFF